MVNFLLKIHAYFYGLNDRKHYKGKNNLMWILTNLMSYISEWIVCKIIIIRNMLGFMPYTKSSKEDELIVSMTSYPARIENVWMVIDSILRQTIKPSHFQIWLSEENFPGKEMDLPKKLLKYKQYGLEICWTKDDLGPHKKYLYAFLKYPNKCVITIDDDLYYRKDMLEKLWKLHLEFPNAVCGHRGGVVNPLELYNKWNGKYIAKRPSHQYYLTGCGGIIYPVFLFDLRLLNNISSIRRTSLYTDDLWMKAMELSNNIPVVIGEYYCNPPTLPHSKKNALMNKNCSEKKGRNDLSWEALNKEYNINKILNDLQAKIN